MVALFKRRHVGADVDDDARALVAHDRWKKPFGIGAGNGEVVGMADAAGLDLDEDLTLLGALDVDLDDFQLFPGFEGDSGATFHDFLPHMRCFSQAYEAGAKL